MQNFGEPFFLVIHEGETLSEVKVRIQKKLQVPCEAFSKVHSPYIYICNSCRIVETKCFMYMFSRVHFPYILSYCRKQNLYVYVFIRTKEYWSSSLSIFFCSFSGNLHFCHWVGQNTFRTPMLCLVNFRCVFFLSFFLYIFLLPHSKNKKKKNKCT